MRLSAVALLLAWMVLAACHESAAFDNPILNPSFEDGIGASWTKYSYSPAPPLSSGSPALPIVGIAGGTFNLTPPYTTPDGTYVCGLESGASESKNGGVYQTFTWDDGAGDVSVSVRLAFDLSGSNGAYVRLGVAPGQTTNRTLVSEWDMCSSPCGWTTLTVPVSGTTNTHTVFIEAYQPGGTGYVMSTLWDDVRWTPYLAFLSNPAVTGSDPDHPDTTARIEWVTNLPADSTVEYQSGTGSWQSKTDSNLVGSHSALIDNLQPASTITFRVISTAPGCVDVTSQDYTFKTPIQITNVSAPTGDPDVVVTWKTDVGSTSWVDYGFDTAYGQTSGNSSLVTDHSVTLTGLADGKTYHYRVRSGAANYTTISSADRTFQTMVAPQVVLGNASFERQTGGAPDLYPWTKYKNSQNSTSVDGIIGPYPSGGPAFWTIGVPPNSVSLQAYDGSCFLGSSSYTYDPGHEKGYQNGGVYQRIVVPSPGTYAFCARFATYQSEPIGYLYTIVNIGIDPAGGIDPNASTVKWWHGASSTNDNRWFPGGVLADLPAGVVTVFLGTTQQYGLAARAVAIDDAVFGPPETMNIAALRARARCPGTVLQDKLVTFVAPYTTDYMGNTYQKIYIQEPSKPFGIGVLLGPDPLDIPQVANKITVTGTLMPLGTETVLMSTKWTIDRDTYTLPRPLMFKQKDAGGSARNQVPLYAPVMCNLGVRARLFGKVTWPDAGVDGDVYLDDGSNLPKTFDPFSVRPQVKGIRVRLTAKPDWLMFYKDDYLAATGVLTIDNIGSVPWPEYEYVLEASDPSDWQILHSASP